MKKSQSLLNQVILSNKKQGLKCKFEYVSQSLLNQVILSNERGELDDQEI